MLSPEIKIFDNPDQVAEAFAEELLTLVRNSPGEFHLALSGGSTPKLLFDLLAREYQAKMPWEKIHFWWGDERCVPPADDQSNYKMTHERLLMKVPVNDKQVHRIQGELQPEKAREHYTTEILSQMNRRRGQPAFDLIMLGMGDDGHTASIFPDRMDLLETKKICETAVHPQSGQIRVSLTGNVINNAERVFFLVTGKPKAERIRQILAGEEAATALPAYHIRPPAGKLAFFLDRDAASGISAKTAE